VPAPIELPPTTESVPRARRFLCEALAELDSEADVDTAALLVTELVTNAVLHARTAVTLLVAPTGDRVRVEVHDRSPLHPRIQAYPVTSTTGRGLRLLDTMAADWGVRPDQARSGKTVWFEVGPPTADSWAGLADDWLAEGPDHDL
jgi:anti-sigma regulatory factor (Ser/Thr protein kinase)